jgi:hypothetical protein
MACFVHADLAQGLPQGTGGCCWEFASSQQHRLFEAGRGWLPTQATLILLKALKLNLQVAASQHQAAPFQKYRSKSGVS